MTYKRGKLKKYAELWNTLKEKYPEPVEIHCPPEVKQTIKNQMANEKALDEDWPLRRYTKLTSKFTPNGIIFTLKPYRILESFRLIMKQRG